MTSMEFSKPRGKLEEEEAKAKESEIVEKRRRESRMLPKVPVAVRMDQSLGIDQAAGVACPNPTASPGTARRKLGLNNMGYVPENET